MRRGLMAVALVGAALVIDPTPTSGAPGSTPTSFCARVRPGRVAGTVADAGLDEISGLVASRAHGDILWANEDSGSGPDLVALDPSGAARGRYRVEDAGFVDWEDIAVGPGPDGDRSYLYVGDIGDNASARPEVTVYRVPEPEAAPDGTGGSLGAAEAFRLTYPGGPQDAEALLVEPRTGELVIVTKQLSGRSTVLSVPTDRLGPGSVTAMTRVGEIEIPGPRVTVENAASLPGTLVTGADVAPDGRTVLLRTYGSVLAYDRPEGTPLGEALLGPPCFARQTSEHQGEAVAFSAEGDAYTTISEIGLARSLGPAPATEGPPVNRFEVAAPDEPAPTAPRGVGEEPGRVPWFVVPLGIAAAGVVVLLMAAAVVRRRAALRDS